jgi:hypothetical protein
MTAALPALSQPGLELATQEMSDELVLRFEGTADMHAIEPLDAYLTAIHALAVARNTTCVHVDFRRLEFMNSSCFKSFVTWVGTVQDSAPGEQYRIEFQSNPQMHWQRRSLNALRCFAMDLISIQS